MTRALLGAMSLLVLAACDRHPGLRVIDLRSDSAYAAGHIPSAEHMSLEQLRHTKFRRSETIMLYSGVGGDAAQAWVLLRAAGLPHVYSLSGGSDEWADRRRWRGGC